MSEKNEKENMKNVATEKTKREKVEELISDFQNKNFQVIFFVPDTENVPSGAVLQIYFHALTLKNAGYNVVLMTEKKDYKIPSYIDEEYHELEHTSSEEESLKTSAKDFIIIPEFFTNVMKALENLPATRIVLAQSYDYTINSLLPGMRWKDFKINNVITTSDNMTQFIANHHGEVYDIQSYTIGVPEYFKPKKFKRPVISIISRNPNDTKKIINSFYLKHPELRWISFDNLYNMTRKEFANKMSDTMACVWIDKTAGFGTVPIEAMSCGTVPIGLVPDITPPYMIDNSGAWTDNIYAIPDLIAQVIKINLEDAKDKEEVRDENGNVTEIKVGDEIVNKLERVMAEVASNYTEDKSRESVLNAYEYFVNKRIKEFSIYLGEQTLEEAVEDINNNNDEDNNDEPEAKMEIVK